MALAEHEAGKCPGCGGQISETTEKDNEFAYHVPSPTRCHRCTALEIAQEKAIRNKHPHAGSLLWTVERT